MINTEEKECQIKGLMEYFSCYIEPKPNGEGVYDIYNEIDDPLFNAQSQTMFGQYETLIEKSKHDRKSFDALSALIVNKIKNKEPLADPYLDWIALYLAGDINKPNAKRGAKGHSLKWLEYIGNAIEDLTAKGIKLSRNSITEEEDSACDLVAEALARLGRQPNGYDGVIDCYYLFKRKNNEIKDLIAF